MNITCLLFQKLKDSELENKMFVSEESLNRNTKDSIQCNSRFEYLCLDSTNPAKVLQIFQMLNCDVK